MNLKIIKKTENQAIIEFVGEGHTILNLLRTELLVDERVLMATYDTKFPIMDNPVFRLTTSSGVDPIVVLREATERIIGQCEEFSRQYAQAVR
jgi:DNA-directed RNA polymerase subunit L